MKTRILPALLCLTLWVANSAHAAGVPSVRSVGMAGVRTAVGEGLCGARANPASLAWSTNPGLSLELLSTNLQVGNNGIDLDLYNRTMGAHLDNADKSEILTAIPSSGLATEMEAGASALGIQFGRVALSFTGEASGFSRIPHDVFELLLLGNADADSLRFDEADGEAISFGAARVSTAVSLGETAFGTVHIGVGMAYLQGFAYGRLEDIEGELVTRLDGVRGEARAQMITAGSGAGMGLDLAVASEFSSGWRAGAVLHNAFAQIHFDSDVEERRFVAALDSLDLETLEGTENTDDLYVSEQETTPGQPFTVTLARELNIGVARIGDRTSWSLEWEQGFAERAGTTTTPRVAMGSEWMATGWLPLRFGVAVGGRTHRMASVGLGLQLASFRLDLAAASVGEWLPTSPKGLGLAVGTGLRF